MILLAQDIGELRGAIPPFKELAGVIIEMTVWSIGLVFLVGVVVGVLNGVMFARIKLPMKEDEP